MSKTIYTTICILCDYNAHLTLLLHCQAKAQFQLSFIVILHSMDCLTTSILVPALTEIGTAQTQH